MRNFLVGLPIALILAQTAFGDCSDTTIVLQDATPGFTIGTGVYDPDAAGAVNSIISGCPDTAITVRLNLTSTLAPGLKNTVKLAAPIKITGRDDKTTTLTGVRRTNNPPANTLDTLFNFTENGAAPALIQVSASNRAIISNFGFLRNGLNLLAASVSIAGHGSQISGCHFLMVDNSTDAAGALLEVTGDSVLVERCLFRAPPDGQGRSVAVKTSGSANKIEIRSSVFFSTQLWSTIGSSHIFANTFAGSRNRWEFIFISSSVTNPETNVLIQHNLFVPKVDTLLPPIRFGSTTIVSSDGILKNAYSSSKGSPPLAQNSINPNSLTEGAVTFPLATGVNSNAVLPRGFSNYGPNAPEVKDYPLTELRSDPTLAANNADFGKMFKVFTGSTWNWNGMADIKEGLTAAKLYFPNGFGSFKAGLAWTANVKVGAFVSADTIETPNPIIEGAQGDGLAFSKYALDSAKIKMTKMSFSFDYYKQTLAPSVMYFFFDTLYSNLTVSNDSATLKIKSPFVKKNFSGWDSTLVVPIAMRNSGKQIYVKMLHYRSTSQAAVLSAAAITKGIDVPSYPSSNLALTIVPDGSTGSNYVMGEVSISVSHSGDALDSIRVVATDGTTETSKSLAAPGPTGTVRFDFTGLLKGSYRFYAIPVGTLNGSPKLGASTTPTNPPINLKAVAGDTLYVLPRAITASCAVADGREGSPFCTLDTALVEVKGGGIIFILPSSPVVAMEDIVIPANPSDTLAITISNKMILGKFEDNRPVFRGKTKEAITINRKNVTLRGFVIELPGGSTGRAGISVKASGALIDANVFRTQNKALGVEGPAINIDVGSASMRMTNNVVWGFTKGVQITNSTSNEIKIFNNTFVDDAGIPNSGSTIGILCVGAVKASISNNFFSNIKQPLDSSFKGKTTVVLDHNIFTTGKPNLQLLTNSGGLDSNDALATMDLTKQPGLNKELDDGLGGAFNCSAIRECSSLPAASLTTDVKVNLVSDILGKPRGAKKDVGAYEMVIADATVQGRLKVKTTAVENVFSRFLFEVSTSNYDPAESDTLYVWWVSGALKPTLDGTVPASQLKKFPIKQLESGSINDVADGLNENKLYNLYAAFGRTVGGVRSMGYSYRDTIRTSVNVEPGDCTFQISTSACPSADGVFINSGDPWTGKFLTKVSFSNKVETGSVVKNPQFVTLANPNIYNLNLLSPLPEIIFVINVPSLGVAGSTQSFKATIEMSIPADFLSGKELFLLPEDSSSLPIHVSTWSIEQNGAKTLLTIEGIKGGTLHYAFGRLADAAEPGKVEFSGPTVPTFDYSTAGDSTSHISIAIKGSGFKTANPLVLVSMIPAGGMASGILSGTYPLSTLAVSTNLADLTVDQQKDRYFRYYQKAAGNEVTSTMGAGQNKPFLLDTTVTAGGFDSSIVYKNPNLSINGKGELSEAILSIPINKKYKDGSVGRKASRSIEVEFTIFDGSKVSRSRAFIRSKFKDEHLQSADKKEFKERTWNLYGYPWDEGETGNQSRIVGAKKWDPDELRLMKYNGSGTGKSSFTIYDGGSAAAVKFDSARAIWSGSVRPYDPACESGVSLDYQTFVLPIPAGQWMDISLPFNFSMKMKDILDASGLATSPTIFRFNPSKPPALSWEAIKDTSVLHPWDGLTIKPTSAITLKFPVLDSARSLAAGGPKTAAPNKSNWTARLLAYNSTAAMSLQIGKSSREGVYGEAPDVPGQDFRMVLKRFRPDGSVEGLSEFVQSDEGTWQGHWLLQSLANKGTQSITLKVSDNNQAIPLYLVESLHKTVLPLNGDSIHLSESELKFNDYHVVAGDANYLEGILAGISPANTMSLSNYPNPFSGSTLIRYALPASMGKVVFNLRVTDFRGKTVFEKNIKGFNSLSYLWDGTNGKQSPLPAGVYTLSLETKIAGKSSYKATRRILKM